MYDATAFLRDHPGGAESILLASGMDASDDFNAIHSAKAKKMVEEYYIGDLDDSAGIPLMALQALLSKLSALLLQYVTASGHLSCRCVPNPTTMEPARAVVLIF